MCRLSLVHATPRQNSHGSISGCQAPLEIDSCIVSCFIAIVSFASNIAIAGNRSSQHWRARANARIIQTLIVEDFFNLPALSVCNPSAQNTSDLSLQMPYIENPTDSPTPTCNTYVYRPWIKVFIPPPVAVLTRCCGFTVLHPVVRLDFNSSRTSQKPSKVLCFIPWLCNNGTPSSHQNIWSSHSDATATASILYSWRHHKSMSWARHVSVQRRVFRWESVIISG